MRAASLCIALILVLTLVPVPAAAVDECQPGPCHTIALYLHAASGPTATASRLLSSLPGDAMPSDVGTRSAGGLNATTRALAGGLTVMKEDAFRVNLTSPSSSPDHVNGSIRVLAIDLAGNTFTLAERLFTTRNTPLFQGFPPTMANVSVDGILADAPPQVETMIDVVHARANGTYSNATATFEGAGLAGAATAASYAAVCGNAQAWTSNQCKQLTGRLGQGQLAPCTSSPTMQDNIVGALVWTAVHTVDPIQRDHTGRSVCASTFDDANRTAQTLDEATGANGSLLPAFPGRDALFEHPAGEPVEWKDVTLDATPPAWLPQNDASFTLPAGLRLALKVSLSTSTRSPEGQWIHQPVVFEAGTPTATTALHVRTSTPGTFAAFAYGVAPILPGRHTGFFSNTTDADDFTFTAPAGSTIRASNVGPVPLTFRLYDENGAMQSGASVVAAAKPGAWTLRVERSGNPTSASEYAFILETAMPATPDEGGMVPEGVHVGTLAGSDTTDTFYLFAWQAQRFSARLEHTGDVGFDLTFDDDASSPGATLWSIDETSGATFHALSARPSQTTWLALRVSRTYGEGPYSLMLDVDERGNLSLLPLITPLWPITPGDDHYQGLVGHGDGVDVTVVGPDPRIDHLTTTSRSVERENISGATARTADGGIVHADDASGQYRWALSLGDDEPSVPFARDGNSFVFGPDGSFTQVGAGIRHTAPDWTETFLSDNETHRVLYSPSGELYAFQYASTSVALEPAFLVDLAAGTLTRAETFDGVRAFDQQGRPYRILNRTLIERYDPATDEHVVVASSQTVIRDIAFGGDDLFAIADDGGVQSGAVGFAPLGTLGFAGFEPSFAARPLADLVLGELEDVFLGTVLVENNRLVEQRLFRVHVRNNGTGAALASMTYFSIGCNCNSTGASHATPMIDPGQEAIIEVRWDARAPVLEYEVHVYLDFATSPWDAVIEADESNNHGSYDAEPVTGPARDTCRDLVGSSSSLYLYCNSPRL